MRDILANATLDDIVAICVESFGLPPIATGGAALRDELYKINESDTWFASHLKPGAVDDKGAPVSIVPVAGECPRGLTDAERNDLAALLALANVTWMQGQAFRSETDPTRRDPYQRGGVYRPYNNLVSAQTDTLKAIYDVVKDLHELQEKAKLSPGLGLP